MNEATPPSLCVADDATFWAWHSWPEFSKWPNRETTLVVLPIAGLADWGLGHALDLEETVLMHVLRAASQARADALPLLVVPPLRFVLGPDPGCAFPVEASVAHALIAEVLASVAASGFRRVVLYNSSPWNEEFIAAAARDNRIALGLQIFRISLSGIGLDLHPTRSQTRRKVQTLVTALTGCAPEFEPPESGSVGPVDSAETGDVVSAERSAGGRDWGDERVAPLGGKAVAPAKAQAEGAVILREAARHLLALLAEIHARPSLADGGAIPAAQG